MSDDTDPQVAKLRVLLTDILMSGLLVHHRLTALDQYHLERTVQAAADGEQFEPLGQFPSPGPTAPTYEEMYGAVFFEELGRMVVRWNRADEAVRGVLATICAPSPRDDGLVSTILTANLSPSALQGALLTYAASHEHEHLSPRLRKASEYHEVLAQHRNEYVHGVKGIKDYPGFGPSGHSREASGAVMHVRVRGKKQVMQTDDRVPSEHVEECGRWAMVLEQYAKNLQKAVRAHLTQDVPQWPEMPTCPPRLKLFAFPA